MKKILSAAGLLLAAASGLHANSLQVINFNPCPVYGITQGGMITVASGASVFYASPANIANPSATPSGTFSSLTYDITPSFFNPVFISAAAPTCAAPIVDCTGGATYCYQWNVSSTGNIVLIFF